MTVVVRVRGTDKRIEVEDVVNFRMDTAHFWLTLKGDKYRTFWRRNVELVRIKENAELEKENAELKEELNYAKTHCLFHSDCPNQKELASIKLKVDALAGDIPWNELKDKSEVIGKLTRAKEIILKLYNAGRDVLMCRAEEKAFDNLSKAINDKSIEQILEEI